MMRLSPTLESFERLSATGTPAGGPPLFIFSDIIFARQIVYSVLRTFSMKFARMEC
jgi:hypothetical protein